MHNQVDITAIFMITDDFCKVFENLIQEKVLCDGSGQKFRNRASTMSQSEVITILVFFHLGGYRNFKHLYINHIQKFMKSDFPVTVSYNRFVELSQKAIIPMMLFLNTLMQDKCTGITFIDSTPIRVCHNRRIHNHKVFKPISTRGHCSLGFFFGFKLHIVLNDKGELISYVLTQAKTSDVDKSLMETLTKSLFGKLYVDKGYISKSLFEMLFQQGIHVVTKIRRNMKNCLMTLKDKILIRKRALIESVIDELKNICQIEHSTHRSINNFFANLLSGLIANCFLPKKPSIKVEYQETGQLSLF